MPPKTKSQPSTCPERGDESRKKLIEAGLKIFSKVGYDAASTRCMATAADANIAAIPYYFHSKEGFYLAVIDYVIDFCKNGFGNTLTKIKQALRDKETTPSTYRTLFDEYMHTLIHFVLREDAESLQISHIYIREQLDPTSAFNRLYDGFIGDMQKTLEALVAVILGLDAHSSDIRLITKMLLGHVTLFISSRTIILHSLGRKNYGKQGIADIERLAMFNVNAIMQAYQRKVTTNDKK